MATATKKPRMQKDEFVSDGVLTLESLDSIEEAQRPKGTLAFISGDAGKCDVINSNGRYYSRAVMESAIRELHESGMLKKGRLLGEIEHPSDGGSLRRAAIKYTDIYIREDKNGEAFTAFKGMVLDNEEGRHLMSLLEAGVDVGMSTRGLAKISTKKMVQVGERRVEADVVEIFKWRGLDPVSNPSNVFGGVTHYESEEDEMDPKDLTVEGLRKDAPDLVTTIESKAREGYVSKADVDKAVTEAVEAAKKGLFTEEQVKTKVDEAVSKISTEIKNDQIKGKVDEAVAAATKPLTEKITKLETDLAEAKKLTPEQEKAARVTAIDEACKVEAHAPFSIQLRRILEAVPAETPLTKELIEEKVDRAKEVWVAMGSPKGSGKTKAAGATNNAGKETQESKDGEERPKRVSPQAALAGIE